ncbi:minor tail protein [Gordonia phage LittleMunchkin]|nr:minor tail protein [Gordonia phage LittleMunchkin]
MTVASPGKAPTTDAEWARQMAQRVARLESQTTVRVGKWVVSADGAVLTATAPGEEPLNLGSPSSVDAEAVEGIVRSAGFATAEQVAEVSEQVTEQGTAVNDLADNITGAVNDGVAVGTGKVREAFDAVLALFGLADSAQRTALAAQQQLQEITAETPTGGQSWSTQFAGGNGTALPLSDWTGSPEIVIRGNSGYAGVAEGSADGTYWKTTTFIVDSDNQSVSMLLGSRTSDNLYTGCSLRSNADGTEGVYVRANATTIQIGRYTRAGSAFTFSGWNSLQRNNSEGDLIRLRCDGDNYYVLVNGQAIMSWPDTSGAVNKGANYRHGTFFEQKGSNVFGGAIASSRLAGFAFADWAAPGAALSTPSWFMRRGTNTLVALSVSHGAVALLPASFYTITDRSSAVGVDLTNGEVTIQETGIYEITATGINRDDNDSGGVNNNNGNTVNAYRMTPWVLYLDGQATMGPITSGSSVRFPLIAGQKVRIGVSASNPNYPSMRGGTDPVDVPATSNITHVGGGPTAVFSGIKVA